MNNKQELENRKEFLIKEIEIKKFEVEKSLNSLEKLCKELMEIQLKLNPPNEIKDSTI